MALVGSGAVPLKVEVTLSGSAKSIPWGMELYEAASSLLSKAGVSLDDPENPHSADSLALISGERGFTLRYSSISPKLESLPALHELFGEVLKVGETELRVESVSGRLIDPASLPRASKVRLRLATPLLLESPRGLPPISCVLESAAELWERHVGIRLSVPAKVVVRSMKLRAVRGWWGVGYVGSALLEQRSGDSLGAVATAASISGAGRWRLLGFGAVETEVL